MNSIPLYSFGLDIELHSSALNSKALYSIALKSNALYGFVQYSIVLYKSKVYQVTGVWIAICQYYQWGIYRQFQSWRPNKHR